MQIFMVETGGWGGIGHYTHCLCSALNASGHRVCLLTNQNRYSLSDFSKNYEVVKIFRGDSFISDWKRLRDALQQKPEGIVHFQSLISTRRDWMIFWKYRLINTGKKFLMTVHNVIPHESVPGELFAYQLLYRAASGLIIHSEASRNKLLSFTKLKFKTPISVIPHGHYGCIVEDERLSRSKSLKVLDLKDYRYIIFFGALRPYKGLKELLKAVKEITDWPPDLKLLIAGDFLKEGYKREFMEFLMGTEFSDKVIFKFEYLPEKHIPALFKLADLIVLPYQKIDQSGVLMSALAAGVPALCTPVGSFPETINSTIGFMAKDTSKEALKYALTDAIKRRDDWIKMGINARSEAEKKYSWSYIAEKTYRFYHQVYNCMP
jgi:glycosyltransferase involved in cell wall biosynthesis